MKNKVALSVALLVIVPLIAQISFAQLFPNAPWNRSRTSTRITHVQSCPGGVCPTNPTVIQSQRTVFTPVQSTRHWTYPGNIDEHLQAGHGVSGVGLTHEQKLSLHDALHENRVIPQTIKAPVQPTVSRQATPRPQAREVRTPASEDSTFGLGAYSKAPIPHYVMAQVGDQPTEVRTEFKSALLNAISEARKSDRITLREAVSLRVACISPAFLQRAQDLAVTQLAFSGESSEHIPTVDGVIQVDGINWEGLAKFMEVFIPLLVTLLKAFGL